MPVQFSAPYALYAADTPSSSVIRIGRGVQEDTVLATVDGQGVYELSLATQAIVQSWPYGPSYRPMLAAWSHADGKTFLEDMSGAVLGSSEGAQRRDKGTLGILALSHYHIAYTSHRIDVLDLNMSQLTSQTFSSIIQRVYALDGDRVIVQTTSAGLHMSLATYSINQSSSVLHLQEQPEMPDWKQPRLIAVSRSSSVATYDDQTLSLRSEKTLSATSSMKFQDGVSVIDLAFLHNSNTLVYCLTSTHLLLLSIQFATVLASSILPTIKGMSPVSISSAEQSCVVVFGPSVIAKGGKGNLLVFSLESPVDGSIREALASRALNSEFLIDPSQPGTLGHRITSSSSDLAEKLRKCASKGETISVLEAWSQASEAKSAKRSASVAVKGSVHAGSEPLRLLLDEVIPEDYKDSPFPQGSDVIAFMIRQRLLPGSLLSRLVARAQWNNILLGFEPSFAIRDFSEKDMCALLDTCPQAFLERNLLAVMNYDYTVGHMRMALIQLRCERLLDVLKMLQSWMQQIDDRRSDEVERVFSDPLVRKKSRKKSHNAAEDPLDEFGLPRILQFATLLLDAQMTNLLKNPACHTVVLELSGQLRTFKEEADNWDDLGTKLGIFEIANDNLLSKPTKKTDDTSHKKPNDKGDGPNNARSNAIQASLKVQPYSVDELLF